MRLLKDAGYKEWFPHLKAKFERGTEENGKTYLLELSYTGTACGLLVTYMFKQSATSFLRLKQLGRQNNKVRI